MLCARRVVTPGGGGAGEARNASASMPVCALLSACLGAFLLAASAATASDAHAIAPAASPSAAPHHGETGRPRHGIAMHGEPALPADFSHLPYANPDAPRGGRLTLGFQGTFDSLNPFNLKAGSTARGLVGNVFQTLMMRSLDEPFTLYGLIAESIETNADRSMVVFRLDRRARFSDGKPLTAADVRFSVELLGRQGRPQHRAAFSNIRTIETPDSHTVRFDLTGADDRELPLILALMPVLPAHATDVENFADATLAVPVGSGPYILDSFKAGESLRFRRDANYWAKDLPSQRGFNNFDEIRIEYFRDASSLFQAFQAGLVDYIEEDNPTRWRTGYDFPALREGLVKKESLALGGAKGMRGFAFNTRRTLFSDVRVREALTLMFDFEWINASIYGGLFQRTMSFFDNTPLSAAGKVASPLERKLLARWPRSVREDILDGTWRMPASDGSGRDRTLARQALKLLADAGYRVRDGVMRQSAGGAPLAFEILVNTREQERLALIYSQSLRRIGVAAQVRQVDQVQYQRRRARFDFDMMIGWWVASNSPGNEQRNRWSSTAADIESSFNLAGARSEAIDGLIQEILGAHDRETFEAAVRAFDRVLLSGFYIVPLYHKADQWIAYRSDLRYPARLPEYGAPLFGETLNTWWRAPQ